MGNTLNQVTARLEVDNWVAIALGCITATLSLAMMVAWHLHLPLLHMLHKAAPMRYNIGVAFLLDGLALVALGRRKQRLAGVLSTMVIVILFHLFLWQALIASSFATIQFPMVAVEIIGVILLGVSMTLVVYFAETTNRYASKLDQTNQQLKQEIIKHQQAEEQIGFLQALTQVEEQIRSLQTLTLTIAESPDFDSALKIVLSTVCETQGWDYGEAWIPCQNQNVLKLSSASCSSAKDVLKQFRRMCEEFTFPLGVGLPGRVWSSQQPEWLEDVSQTPEVMFLRRHIAVECGIKAGLGIPIISHHQVLAVLVFFKFEAAQEDNRLVESLLAVAAQLSLVLQRRRVEDALRDSEARFQAFMNHSPALAFMKDEEGRFVYINEQLERVFNVKLADFRGKTDFDLASSAEAARQVRENDQAVLATGLPAELVETFPTPDGSLHYWLVLKFPFQDAFGCTYVGGVAIDITERKRMEQELFEQKELAQVTLQSIGDAVQSIGDAVLTTNALGEIQSLNPVAEVLTGWSQQSAQNLPLTEVFKIVNETTREQLETPVEFALREGSIVGLANDTVLISRNGDEFAIENSAAPIRASNGQIIGAVMVFHDTSTTRHLSHQLTWQASHDALTGLVNRREFENRLEQALTLARSQNQQHALCYLDLDQFKIVNDTCGHIVGDELLRQVTALFQTQVRTSDTLARLGGDEFGILLSHCSLQPALRIANKLREGVQAFRFVCQDKIFNIGVSIGLVEIHPDSESVTSILSAADAACYAAKNNGRNRVHIYQANDSELTQQHGEMQWVTRINQALEENRFRLYYQPIVPLTQTQLNGEHYEVLLRLVDEMGNLVSPMAFIPAAERYNLMQVIDRWVISTLFSTQGQHYREAGCDCLYAINLSGASINDQQFVEFLHEQLALYQIPPALICFEITETVAIANLGKAAQFIQALRDLGCRFALDDFGSGMSSFVYLKNLPIDYLKIDGSFVKNIVDQPIDLAMVEAINQIGHVMGIKTIAEFVENQDILEKITNLGVDYAQGYGIAKPAPLAFN